MQETYQPGVGQKVAEVPGNKWAPDSTYSAWDSDGSFAGDFLTRGAANFVLGCQRQIRESQARRKGK